jgi:hypothetical protein
MAAAIEARQRRFVDVLVDDFDGGGLRMLLAQCRDLRLDIVVRVGKRLDHQPHGICARECSRPGFQEDIGGFARKARGNVQEAEFGVVLRLRRILGRCNGHVVDAGAHDRDRYPHAGIHEDLPHLGGKRRHQVESLVEPVHVAAREAGFLPAVSVDRSNQSEHALGARRIAEAQRDVL